MSLSERTDSMASHFLDKKARHNELWGIDLQNGERHLVEIILDKFLSSHSAIPALQLSRTSASLRKTLEWRRYSEPRALLSDAGCLLSELDLCHITLYHGQYVLWVEVDDRNIKGHSQIHQNLATSAGIVKLGLALMEKLTTLLLSEGRDPDSYSASCVVHFRTRIAHDVRKELLARTSQSKLYTALEELVTLIRLHYPGILEKAYIINPSDEYFASLDIPESLLKNTILLQNPQHLADYLSSQIPPEYGGTGKSLIKSDFLPSSSFHITPKESLGSEKQSDSAYVLDGTGYIVMSYKQGEPLGHYWDHVSEAEQNRILEQLRDYVSQMRSVTGEFIGGLDESPCRDGIFEAGYGDYMRYSYGPYPSGDNFNEGIVQALRG